MKEKEQPFSYQCLEPQLTVDGGAPPRTVDLVPNKDIPHIQRKGTLRKSAW